jgi:hypothetical protein
MKQTLEDLLEAKVQISLLNEPAQPTEPPRESAREIARRRWKMENEQEK